MRVIDANIVHAVASMPLAIAALHDAFGRRWSAPPRRIENVPDPAGSLLLIMPAFDFDGLASVKLAMVSPGNRDLGLPTVQGLVIVFSDTGTPIAVLEGAAITRIRTAAASALASRYLSRPDSTRLVIFGTGALAPYMASAHCCERDIEHIVIVGRRVAAIDATITAIEALVPRRIVLEGASNGQIAVRDADIISCATTSPTPVIKGAWLQPGVFVDLVGSFRPDTRECDDETVRRARLFVDTEEGALREAGDLIDPISRGVVSRDDIVGDMADLVSHSAGRRSESEITLFKSVGAAIEDLAIARLVLAAWPK
jgi:ornithine cyclodeaminase